MNNLARAFVDWIVSIGIATSGQVAIHRAPTGTEVDSTFCWVTAAGGGSVEKSVNGKSIITNTLAVYYRANLASEVYDKLEELRNQVLCADCLSLSGYDVIEVTTEGIYSDQDIDNESRTVGLLQITLTTYEEC